MQSLRDSQLSHPQNIRNLFYFCKTQKQNLKLQKLNMERKQTDYEVIVIGAGAAGIGTGITLQRAGVPYLIIQARDRLGGRLQNAFIDGIQVDLGGCWVHSYSQNNVICKEIKKLGWEPKQIDRNIKAQIVDEQTGSISQDVMAKAQGHFKRFFQISSNNAKKSETDLSIYQAAQDYYKNHIEKQHKEVKRLTDMLINMKQHYDAAMITQLSAKNYDCILDTGGDFGPKHSYATLMLALAQGLNVQLNTKVKSIQYAENKVKIVCENQKIYTARKVVCSLPLGILKANTVKFSPQLPDKHKLAIQKLGLGVMNKIIMAFEKPFWDQGIGYVRIACEERGKYPCMYNFSTNDKHILCCFITGDFAKKISKWTDQEITKDIFQTLIKSFKGKKIVLKEVKITRWDKDPLSLGSYTHFQTNSSIKNCYDLRSNIKDTLWIVGEHCYAQHIGCAHGAYQTGVWASEEIIKKSKQVKKVQTIQFKSKL